MIESLTETWEEIKEHDAELAGRTVTLTVYPEPTQPRTPNYAMLESMREADVFAKRIKHKSEGTDTVEVLRQARAGAMFGYEPTE